MEQDTLRKRDPRALLKKHRRVTAAIAGLFVVAGVVGAPAVATAAPVNTTDSGVTSHCWGGRCEFLFSKSTTRSIAQGELPAAASNALGAASSILVLGHRIIAQQYVNRGWCSAFLVSVWPWESQGYTGYACSWE